MDIDKIKSHEQEIQEEEYHYRLTGEYEGLNNAKYSLGKYLSDYNTEDLTCGNDKNQYQDYTRYLGDQKLLHKIYDIETEFKQNRKNIMQSEYESRLRNLVKLRNEFAESAGFNNYIDLRYHMFGVNTELLRYKITKEYQNEIEIKSKIDIQDEQLFIKTNHNSKFNKENQSQLAGKILQDMGIFLKDNEVIYHFDNLPQFYAGAVVPLQIPNEIHVFMNKVSGLSGLSVFLHEIGHACYYNSINKSLEYLKRKAYNLAMEEGIAIFFENIAFSKEFITEYTDNRDSLLDFKFSKFNLRQMCCTRFDEEIYINDRDSYEEIWNKYSTYYMVNDYSWTRPHFFVSEPGYFAAYLLGNYIARDLLIYLNQAYGGILNPDSLEFIKRDICFHGRDLNFLEFLKVIDF